MKNPLVPRRIRLLGCSALLLATVAARADYSNTVMTLNPIGYWPLSETVAPPDDTTAPPAHNLGTLGSTYDGTFTSPLDTIYGAPGALAGTTDTANRFNAFSTRVTATHPFEVNDSTSFTIEAWINGDDGTEWGTQTPFSDVDANSPRSGWLTYVSLNSPGEFTFRTYNQNGTAPALDMDILPAGGLKPYTWTHIAIVVDGTNVTAYVNGAVKATGSMPSYIPNDGAAGGFNIAGRSDGDAYDYLGSVDEVAYYTNALDAATILSHYQAATNSSPTTAYSALVLQKHPALYYRMDEVALFNGPYFMPLPVAKNYGSLGSVLNGYYQPGTVPGVAGPTNSGFGAVSRACSFSPSGSQNGSACGPGVLVAPYDEAALNIFGGLSLTAWIQIPTLPTWFETVIGRTDYSYRMDADSGFPAGLPHFAAAPNGDVVGTKTAADGQWHLWTGVFDPATSTSYLYIDGIVVASGQGSAISEFTTAMMIGGSIDYHGRNFSGNIAHVALFDRALSASEVSSLYTSVGAPPAVLVSTNQFYANQNGTATIPAQVSGTAPISLQWYYIDGNNVTNSIAGATNATLTISNVQPDMSVNQYYLLASNGAGSSTSDLITLSINQGIAQFVHDVTPAAVSVPVGVPINYAVQVTGTEPFSYQWYDGANAISGATNATLAVTAQSGTHSYSVKVTNGSGTSTSASSAVTGLTTPPPVISLGTTGTGWTLNGSVAQVTNSVLLLTDGKASEASSAFFNTPQYVGGFVSEFTYQAANGDSPLADGFTFCVQNSASGATAVGGGGGELGYTGIGNSAAFEINIYNGHTLGIGFGTDGATGGSGGNAIQYASTAPVNPASLDPIRVRLFYLQGVMHVSLTDLTTSATYSTSHTFGDLTTILQGPGAYVGFSAATGGADSVQTVSNFTFTYTTTPVLTSSAAAGQIVIRWPVSVSPLFVLQQSSSLGGAWTTVATAPVVVNGQNQVSLPATASAGFYRLSLQ